MTLSGVRGNRHAAFEDGVICDSGRTDAFEEPIGPFFDKECAVEAATVWFRTRVLDRKKFRLTITFRAEPSTTHKV